jgi:thiamine biosynthesis lipoprotein
MMRRIEWTRTDDVMGGQLTLRVAGPATAEMADHRMRQVASRVRVWAARLSRFDPRSELSGLNGSTSDPGPVAVSPTLAAVLGRAARLAERTEGIVDVTLLDERLHAQQPRSDATERGHRARAWRLGDEHRRRPIVERCAGLRFDLDGVAKGWIADRARVMLADVPSAIVDADGDIALHVAPGMDWEVAVADPADASAELARFRVADRRATRILGIATSGTSVHRWEHADGTRHHLIDPRTGRPATTDIVQATVVAEDATTAEGLAKAAVIVGSDAAGGLLERAGAWAAVLLRVDGDVIASPSTIAWLAR